MRHARGSFLASLGTTALIPLSLVSLSSTASAQSFQFVERAGHAGLSIPMSGGRPGAAVGDYNGDGWMDIIFFGMWNGRMRIFRNNGNRIAQGAPLRNFTDVTSMMLPQGNTPCSIGIVCDLDNDGDQDILTVRRYVSASAPGGDPQDTGIMYYEHNGVRYTRGHSDYNLARHASRSGGLSVGDVDNDSDLDIVFVHNDGAGAPGFFIRNDGGLNFSDASASFGADISTPNRFFTTLLTDFNGDMWPDLHIAVDFYSDMHCHNQWGTFVDVTQQVGATHGGSDMGACCGDPDNDGDMDIYSTNINIGVLYMNDGLGNFVDEANQRGVFSFGPGTTIGWGTAFADLDLDGDEDLSFVANEQSGKLWANQGDATFVDQTNGLNLLGHGLIPFDYDNDGDQDLLVIRAGQNNHCSLYENQTPRAGRHWLSVDLVGTHSNRDGIGARLRLTTGALTQTRHIMGGYSFKSGPPHIAHFGLNTATSAELEITWPSGVVQVLQNVAADQALVIEEP